MLMNNAPFLILHLMPTAITGSRYWCILVGVVLLRRNMRSMMDEVHTCKFSYGYMQSVDSRFSSGV